MEVEIGATALSLCATEVGICWHSCWVTEVELASTDSGDAEEARRSCEIEATAPCPTSEGGGAIADCCEVRISISEKSGASSGEDGADKGQGVSFMVNRYLERRFAINKNSSSSCSDAKTGYQRCKHGSTDNQGLTNIPCGASSCDDRRFYQTIKDLRTDVQGLTNNPCASSSSDARTYEQTCKHGPTVVRGN